MELSLNKKKKRLSLDDFKTENQAVLSPEIVASAKGGSWGKIVYEVAKLGAAAILAYDELSDDCH